MTRPDRDAVSPPSAVSSGTGGEATGIFLFPNPPKDFRPSASSTDTLDDSFTISGPKTCNIGDYLMF